MTDADLIAGLAEFEREVEAFAKSIEDEQIPLFVRRLTLEFVSRVVPKTPVRTGRARGNWQVGVGSIPSGESFSGDPISAANIDVSRLRGFPVVYVTNNVPYILFLEQGSSTQAPQGMIALTLAEMQRLFP